VSITGDGVSAEWASAVSPRTCTCPRPVRRPAIPIQWLTKSSRLSWIERGSDSSLRRVDVITWCPVGIDVTEEIAAIRANDGAVREKVTS
jgi:hypothetical protein